MELYEFAFYIAYMVTIGTIIGYLLTVFLGWLLLE